jgi:hypothetical protein
MTKGRVYGCPRWQNMKIVLIIKNSLSKIFSGSKETARLSARDYFDSGFAEPIGRERESCLKREWTT